MKNTHENSSINEIPTQIDKSALQFLQQVLSPVNYAALQNDYRPFMFKFEKRRVYISPIACAQLKISTEDQISFFRKQIEYNSTIKKVPENLEGIFIRAGEVISLPSFVRFRLFDIECYTMQDIMIRGRDYFLDESRFGTQAVKVIDELFERHGCRGLFV